jgi:hypothetical protein
MRLSAQQLRLSGYQEQGERWVKGPEPPPSMAPYLRERPSCPGVPGREYALSCALARTLDELTLNGRLKAVWSATEVSTPRGGKRGKLTQARLRAAGVNPGWPDYTFLWGAGAGVIELKSPLGSLGHAQQAMRRWCQKRGVRYGVARSIDEALDHLTAWGVLSP